jgi:ubiquinone/menaquinone biosynthesis C-methylase UbiE
MSRSASRTDVPSEALDVLGDEWGRPEDVRQVVAEWIRPNVSPTSVVGEVGTGGGRIARQVAPDVGEFHAFDVAPKMLARAEQSLAAVPSFHFHVVAKPVLPSLLESTFDFIYSFDVFVHLDLHVQWSYLREFARVLKPGGLAFVHTSNLRSEPGWARFSAQEAYRVEGFYFVTPEMVRELARRAGFEVEKEIAGTEGNFYYERDYLVLLRKPSGSQAA